MKPSLTSFLTLALLGCAPLAHGASIAWSTSPGVNDSEVSAIGTAVFGYYFNSDAGRPASVDVNSVPFALHTTASNPAGLNLNGSFNFPENVDAYQVPDNGSNGGLNQILDGQSWGAQAALSLTDLAVGTTYQVQLMLSDDRANFLNARNYDVSDGPDPEGSRDIEFGYHSTRGGGVPGNAPAGASDAKIFTGTFTADAATQDIHTWLYEGLDHSGGNSGSQVNAIQLRVIPEPAALVLTALSGIALILRRRHR